MSKGRGGEHQSQVGVERVNRACQRQHADRFSELAAHQCHNHPERPRRAVPAAAAAAAALALCLAALQLHPAVLGAERVRPVQRDRTDDEEAQPSATVIICHFPVLLGPTVVKWEAEHARTLVVTTVATS